MITVIGHAKYSYAEVVLHDGEDACKIGGEPYMDNSRNSVVCAEHRKEYQRQQRGKKWSKTRKRSRRILSPSLAKNT